ncbi:MAG: hypothetical protein HC765_11345 [Brachymonas sp.]|nr:hypothetical protein [Brachymonas sp.]
MDSVVSTLPDPISLGEKSNDLSNTLDEDSPSSLPAHSSEFFNSQSNSGEVVSTHPMGLPPEEAKLEGRPPGRLFEYLRQAVLQRSAKEFNDLPLQIKAAARIGGLIYTERATFYRAFIMCWLMEACLEFWIVARGNFSFAGRFNPKT